MSRVQEAELAKQESEYKLDHTVKKTKVSDHIYDRHTFDVDVLSNHIYLFGIQDYVLAGAESDGIGVGNEPGIEYVVANRFIRNVNLLMRLNPNKPIIVHMKSAGGDWNEGMAIYDTIKNCPSPVTILSYTHARSMTSIILQAANKRVLMPHSYFMFHMGTNAVTGTAKSVQSYLEFSKRTDAVMLDIYAHAIQRAQRFMVGADIAAIKKWLKKQMDSREEVWLMPEEAVNFGLADAIFDKDWTALTAYTEEELSR